MGPAGGMDHDPAGTVTLMVIAGLTQIRDTE